MRRRDLAASALVAGHLFAWPGALSAQVGGSAFVEVAVGTAMKSSYGVSDSHGPVLSARVGRLLLRRAALRLEAELQTFDFGNPPYVVTAPCPLTGPCGDPSEILGAGPIRMAGALASLQWYEQADRRGFYLLAGLGPQVVTSHPDRARALRLAAQAGAGVTVAGAVLIEVRYQASLGARAEPRHVVLVTVGLRYALPPRAPVQRMKLATRRPLERLANEE